VSTAATAALEHVTRVALAASPAARARLKALVGPKVDVDQLSAGLLRRGRVALHFHPDRLVASGRTVAESLLVSGRYVSQFVTGISAGGLTAVPGGDRDRWEERMFGGAYQTPGVLPVDRPVYGALDLLGHADGPAPRFGSCRLRLRPEVLTRTTFTVGDSNLAPADAGTASAVEPIVAGLVEELAAGRLRLGAPELDVAGLVRLLLSPSAPPVLTARLGRAMDEYLEAQVHGPVLLTRHIELLVADPSFEGTPTGTHLQALADYYGFLLRWHPGFALPVDDVPAAPRGDVVPRLARLLRERYGVDVVTAAAIGDAARDVVRDPGAWSSWATPAETLQHLKYLWHVLVIAGSPARRRSPAGPGC
jgi:Protein of unknown function (DUF3626)